MTRRLANTHIGPGSVLGGAVRIGNGAHIGTGSTVIENRCVGSGALVGAGACVIHDIKAGERVAGVPRSRSRND